MDLIIQFCDNCSSQYKSRRPFAELARSPLDIIRIYFGEKHGKGQCDGFFGRLKSWMMHKIKSRHVIINSAHDFFRCCKEQYETQPVPDGHCQHYRVVFQFLRPSDIRRHQDCDLDQAVTGTCSIYSMRNTEHPLKLKVRHVPCVCPPCILDNGEVCHNSSHTDPWREVDLIPCKNDNRRKHEKRKHPKDFVQVIRTRNKVQSSTENVQEVNVQVESSDSDREENIPDLQIEENGDIEEELIDLTEIGQTSKKNGDGVFIDLTEGKDAENGDVTLDCEDFEDVLNSDEQADCEGYVNVDETLSIPDNIYWESLLGALEKCTNFSELEKLANEIVHDLRPLKVCTSNVFFRPDIDFTDTTAYATLPVDGPSDVVPRWTLGDGNCMARSLSTSYTGNDSMHLEIRARIVIDAIINKKYYLDPNHLNVGATYLRDDETLLSIFAKYSDHYVSGQKITQDTIEYLYCREVHDCTKINSYMGLWQICQASSALNVPIQSVYPIGGDDFMRLDFH